MPMSIVSKLIGYFCPKTVQVSGIGAMTGCRTGWILLVILGWVPWNSHRSRKERSGKM